MPRCQICSFELAQASDRCPKCGAAAGGGDSTLVNTDFDPAELLRAAAALADDDERATRDARPPAETTMSYEDGSEEAAFVQQLLSGSRPDPDLSGDSTSVFPGSITAPADMTAEDPPALSRARDVLAAAGFPNPDSVVEEDDGPTGNLPSDLAPNFNAPTAPDDAVADDATIQEQDLADFLDADMRAAIAELKANTAPTTPPDHDDAVDEDATFEMQALVRPRRSDAPQDDDVATQQLMRDEVLGFMAKPAPQQASGDATVELRNVKEMLPAKSTQPTKLPPIPLPPPPQPGGKKLTQPTHLQATPSAPRPPQPSMMDPAAPPNRPAQHTPFGQQQFSPPLQGAQFNDQFNSQFNPQPQGSQFMPQPQGSHFIHQPQGSQFMPQPQGSQFMPQGSQFIQQPLGSQIGQQPGLPSGFPQSPPPQPVAPSSKLILGLPAKMVQTAAIVVVLVVCLAGVAIALFT